MAKKRGLDGIAVMDHNKLYRGPLNVEGVEIIPGSEISAGKKDHVLAYFIENDIEKGKSLKETASSIHRQGGYAFWAHPLRKEDVFKREEESVFRLFDGLESGNAMGTEKERETVSRKCKEMSLLETAGSDGHIEGQVGMGVMKVPERINKKNFLEVIEKGEVIIRREFDFFRKSNQRWGEVIEKWKRVTKADSSSFLEDFFTLLLIRNYLRIKNIKLRKINFNYKKGT